MSVLKWQVNSSLNFTLFFIAMTNNSSVNCKVIPFLRWTKGSKSQFWHFQVLWWKFVKILMSFFKPRVSFSSKFAYSSVSWKITPLYFCSSNIIYFGHKEAVKTQIFSSARVKVPHVNLKNDKSVPLQFLYHSSLSWQITLILSTYIFYVGQKDPIKVPILTLSSALVKICQIPHVIVQTTSQFFFKFCITLECHER